MRQRVGHSALRGVRRAVREDLCTARARPMPPMTWPAGLAWLPHSLIVLWAAALTLTGADTTARILAVLHSATLVCALRRPAPAWWASLVMTAVIVVGHPPTQDNQVWVWLVDASVLFLLALRVRPAAALSAALGTSAVLLVLKATGHHVGSAGLTAGGIGAFAAATAAGALLHARRRDRARLTAQIEATAQERAARTVLEERTRIARELHDVVAHQLSVISIKADVAPHRVPNPPPELVGELSDIATSAREGLGELRRLLGVLRPSAETELAQTAPQPSLDHLDTLLNNVNAAGLAVSLNRQGQQRPLAPGVELSGYRIVQEALSNALRHAPGSSATVTLRHTPHTLFLDVTNTAPAHQPPALPGSGHGLTGMRERVHMLGGTLSAGPTSDGGWQVAAELPLPRELRSPRTDKDALS